MKISKKVGATLTVRFAGTSMSLIGARTNTGGYASIYLDGVLKTSSLSFYASATKYKQTLWSITGLTAGSHTLQVVARGTKPVPSKGLWVYMDAFVVDAGTVQETDPSVVDGFRRISTASAYGSSYQVIDHISATGKAGPTLTMQFKGTGIAWYATKANTYGKAYVYIDNVKKATVDLYRSATAYKQKVWTSATLSNAVHTIKIVVLGTKQTASHGYDVSFDYLLVR
jgi:hypothetical protein